jgi:hypothetical protein
MRINKLLLMAALGLTMSALSSQAGISWTFAQSVQQYGQPTRGPIGDGIGKTLYFFKTPDYLIMAGYSDSDGRIGKIFYNRPAGFDQVLINWLIRENCPTATQWRVESKLDGTTMWIGPVYPCSTSKTSNYYPTKSSSCSERTTYCTFL